MVALTLPQIFETVYEIVSIPEDIPVIIPPEMEVVLLLEFHNPPGAVSERISIAPAQILEAPVIVPAIGIASTLTIINAMAVPQLLVTIYFMLSTPGDTPVTIPPETLAPPELAFQTPPGAVSIKVIDESIQTPDEPAIVPATGSGFTVINLLTISVPQLFITEYLIVSLPAISPVINPATTVAIEGLVLLQIPPGVVSVKVIKSLTHTTEIPVIVPADGIASTVNNLLAIEVPQLLVIVYLIVSTPGSKLVTAPPKTVATNGLLLLHVPPMDVSVKVKETPMHPIDEPVMIPEFGSGLMVIV